MQRLRQTLHVHVHQGDQTEIQYSAQRTPKSVVQKHPKKSALAEHCLQSGHAILWELSTILHTSTSWRKRCLLEAWEIDMCSTTMTACSCPKNAEP